MTAKKCHEKSGQPLELCQAYSQAGLTYTQISPQFAVDQRGLTTAEDQALEAYYRTRPEPMGSCSPTCVMCHKELYDRASPDGLKR